MRLAFVCCTGFLALTAGSALSCPVVGCPDEGGNAVEYAQGNGHGGSSSISFCVDDLGSNQYNVWITGTKQANVALSGTILCNNNVEIVNLYIDIDRPSIDTTPIATITVTQDPDDPTP